MRDESFYEWFTDKAGDNFFYFLAMLFLLCVILAVYIVIVVWTHGIAIPVTFFALAFWLWYRYQKEQNDP